MSATYKHDVGIVNIQAEQDRLACMLRVDAVKLTNRWRNTGCNTDESPSMFDEPKQFGHTTFGFAVYLCLANSAKLEGLQGTCGRELLE